MLDSDTIFVNIKNHLTKEPFVHFVGSTQGLQPCLLYAWGGTDTVLGQLNECSSLSLCWSPTQTQLCDTPLVIWCQTEKTQIIQPEKEYCWNELNFLTPDRGKKRLIVLFFPFHKAKRFCLGKQMFKALYQEIKPLQEIFPVFLHNFSHPIVLFCF